VRLDGRLKRLEERASASTGSRCPRYELESYFRALETDKREQAGLLPLPYTEEDRKDDEQFLRETLPSSLVLGDGALGPEVPEEVERELARQEDAR
jgi:hypothetical protein